MLVLLAGSAVRMRVRRVEQTPEAAEEEEGQARPPEQAVPASSSSGIQFNVMKKPLLIIIATALLAGCQTTNPAAEIEQLRLQNLPLENERDWPEADRARLREMGERLE